MDRGERTGRFGKFGDFECNNLRAVANYTGETIAVIASVGFTFVAQAAVDPETREPLAQRGALGMALQSYRGIAWSELTDIDAMAKRIFAQVSHAETFRDYKAIRDVYGIQPNRHPVPPAPARHLDDVGYNDFRVTDNVTPVRWVSERIKDRYDVVTDIGYETEQSKLRRTYWPKNIRISHLEHIRIDVPSTIMGSAVAVAACGAE